MVQRAHLLGIFSVGKVLIQVDKSCDVFLGYLRQYRRRLDHVMESDDTKCEFLCLALLLYNGMEERHIY